MIVSGKDVTAAIVCWLEALAAVPMRSVSSQLVRAGELGCRVTGGLPPPPPLVDLIDAERPLCRCSDSDKDLFREKYWHGATWKTLTYTIDGIKKENRIRIYRPDELVAAAVGAPSVRAVRRRIERARSKVRTTLSELKEMALCG